MHLQNIVCALLGLFGGILLTLSFQMTSTNILSFSIDHKGHSARMSNSECQDIISLLQHQRDDLSASMMRLSQTYLQYQCKMEPETISSHGGWCRNIEREKKASTDQRLAEGLIELFTDQTVASFGEGLGVYKQLIDKSQRVVVYDGYDGSPVSETYTDGVVNYLDLTVPVFGFKFYDWVISLEVAEHIPEEFESIYLDNLVRHARKGIVISWSVPGQGGKAAHGHVNEHPLEYVLEAMKKRGFSHDVVATNKLKEAASYQYLANNVNVFRRKEFTDKDLIMI